MEERIDRYDILESRLVVNRGGGGCQIEKGETSRDLKLTSIFDALMWIESPNPNSGPLKTQTTSRLECLFAR